MSFVFQELPYKFLCHSIVSSYALRLLFPLYILALTEEKPGYNHRGSTVQITLCARSCSFSWKIKQYALQKPDKENLHQSPTPTSVLPGPENSVQFEPKLGLSRNQ